MSYEHVSAHPLSSLRDAWLMELEQPLDEWAVLRLKQEECKISSEHLSLERMSQGEAGVSWRGACQTHLG